MLRVNIYITNDKGPGSVVGIATAYGLTPNPLLVPRSKIQ